MAREKQEFSYPKQVARQRGTQYVEGIYRSNYSIMQQLHWLPVRERVIFKHALLVFKALHGLLPPYLADNLSDRNAAFLGRAA